MRILKVAASAALIALVPIAASVTAADKSDVGVNLFTEVFEQVRNNYVEPVTDKQLVEGAIKGMLGRSTRIPTTWTPRNTARCRCRPGASSPGSACR